MQNSCSGISLPRTSIGLSTTTDEYLFFFYPFSISPCSQIYLSLPVPPVHHIKYIKYLISPHLKALLEKRAVNLYLLIIKKEVHFKTKLLYPARQQVLHVPALIRDVNAQYRDNQVDRLLHVKDRIAC